MKKDQYFNLEVNLLNDDNIAAMMLELDAAEALGVYMVLLLHLRTKDTYEASCQPLYMKALARRYDVSLEVLERVLHDYHLFVVDEEQQTFRSPYLDRVMKRLEERWLVNAENAKKGGRPPKHKKIAKTPTSKGQKPNETQERRIEENKSITTIEYNSSNTKATMAGEETAAVDTAPAGRMKGSDAGEKDETASAKEETASAKEETASTEKTATAAAKVETASTEKTATVSAKVETASTEKAATVSAKVKTASTKKTATAAAKEKTASAEEAATISAKDVIALAKSMIASIEKGDGALKIDWEQPLLEPVSPWEELVDQLPEYRSYMEQVGMHSGLGQLFIDNEKRILELFKAHICLYAKEKELHFLKDVKRYFSNFIAAGSITCRTLRETLLGEMTRAENENKSRFEIIVDGQRTYQGYIIPYYAPPRPNASVVWDDSHRKWCN